MGDWESKVILARQGLIVLALASAACATWATELVYTPVNPNFGGSPLNGSALLGQAQAQNKSKDPEADQKDKQSALQQFNDSLQRAVLGRLASALTSNIVGPDGKLIPGTIETSDFIINIVDTGNGSLTVTTTDKTTGGSTSFEVGN
jgi:curli production assembly/transport component CsgF